jgi:Ca-activated chloride channel family protein
MGRRRAPTRPSYPGWIRTSVVAAAVVVGLIAAALVLPALLNPGGTGSSQSAAPGAHADAALPEDRPAASVGAAPCIPLNVLASLENADMVRSLAAAYTAKPRSVDGKCVSVNVSQEKSGVAATGMAGGFASIPAAERPAVWLPDSTAWLRVAEDRAGSAVRQDGASVARSGIVVAMPASMAKAIGWDTKAPSWAEVFAMSKDPGVWERLGHADWGKFKFGKASPTVSTSGLMGLLASYGVAGGNLKDIQTGQLTQPSVISKVKDGELSTSHYMATPEHFLWHARQADDSGDVSEFLSAVIVDEKSVWDYNRGISSNDGVTKQAGKAPREPLLAIYPSDGVLVADNPAVTLTGDWVSSQQRLAADDFLVYARTAQGQEVVKVRKRARALFLLDVSGSMGQEIAPGVTRLQGAKNAVTRALDHFTDDDKLGLAAFSHVGDGPLAPGLVSPVAPFKTNKGDLLAELNALQPVAATPLFEAVGQFAAEQAREYNESEINTIVLLSDGKNDSSHPGDLKSLTEQLSHQHHSTPVLVFTLAYGADADTASLRAIAKASGAHFYDATDPNRLEAVLGDLVTSF